jgi:glycosyltransferase involved in cell wall biosynthesis
VLFPYNRDRVGGSYISSSQLARYLHEETEFEPIIALPKNAKNRYLFERYNLEIVEHNLRVSPRALDERFLGRRAKLLERWLNHFRAWRFFRNFQCDFVHIHDDNSFNIWARVAKYYKLKTIWHVRQEHEKPADRIVSDLADHIICISEGCKSRFDRLPIHKERATVIYNGIDLNEFNPVLHEEKKQTRADLSIPDGVILCGFVGNLVERKRPEWAYDTLKALISEGIRAALCYVGEDRGYPPYKELITQNAKNSIGLDKIHFLGIRSDVNVLMGAFDILLVPSMPHGEPFSRVVAEACALGVPVVACEGVGALERLTAGKDCIVVAEGESHEFAKATVRLSQDSSKIHALSHVARNTAQHVFSYRRMGQETAAYYKTIFSLKR